jgi:hypothetical protein
MSTFIHRRDSVLETARKSWVMMPIEEEEDDDDERCY